MPSLLGLEFQRQLLLLKSSAYIVVSNCYIIPHYSCIPNPYLGIIQPFSFCFSLGVTIIFAYIWFITFCGGFLALAGYMEEQGRHALFIVKIQEAPKDSK